MVISNLLLTLLLLDPITYDWTPSEPLSESKAAWISIMQVLDEAKTPREYQRKLINVLNTHVLSRIEQGNKSLFSN